MAENRNHHRFKSFPMSDCFKEVRESFGINDTVGRRIEKDARAMSRPPKVRPKTNFRGGFYVKV